jgi:hypothetical protein
MQNLRIENQPRLTGLEASLAMQHLTDLTVFSCPNITCFEGVENLPTLQRFESHDTPLSLPVK